MFKILITLLVFCMPPITLATELYVRDGASGDCTVGWGLSDACDQLTTAETNASRGDTIYVADGSYTGGVFNTATSGTSVIEIKKATIADHGSGTNWINTYGDGQAIITSTLTFSTNYWTLNGNGTHTIPSNTSSDYGIKLDLDLYAVGTRGIVLTGTSNITLAYIHIYNATQAGVCSWAHTDDGGYVSIYGPNCSNMKLQNCYIQNSYKDGIIYQNGSNTLVERCYLEGLGQYLDCAAGSHGQALRIWDMANVVVRWNIFDDNDGQGIIAYANTMSNVRTYGNVLFNTHKDADAYVGPNGGVWDFYPDTMTNSYVYNNTIANFADEYPSVYNATQMIYNHGTLAGTSVAHNNMFYNIGSSATMIDSDFGTRSYNAYGLCSATAGGTSQQSGITSGYFTTYDEVTPVFDFRLTQATNDSLDLTGEVWWDDSVDSFFGFLDSDVDMYGNTRGEDGTWDRGAYEYDAGGSSKSIEGISIGAGLE